MLKKIPLIITSQLDKVDNFALPFYLARLLLTLSKAPYISKYILDNPTEFLKQIFY